MKRILFILLALGLLSAAPAAGCFGPKLYFGVGAGTEADILFELVALYVKEKTGTEIVRVDTEGKDPLTLLREEKLDLAFAESRIGNSLLTVAGLPGLVAGDRPLQDLQFTTVIPALKNLNGLLQAEHVSMMAVEVASGASPAATVRRFLMERGWI